MLNIVMSAISTALIGHVKVLNIPDGHLWILLVGMAVLGTASVLVFIPIIPEMCESF